ncbi:MAG: hypothetical protein C6W56_14570 [Caldibacillus debilis]|nr:MAG: hypothetical protein C6W56_14570 [Caldibacillus debilis]
MDSATPEKAAHPGDPLPRRSGFELPHAAKRKKPAGASAPSSGKEKARPFHPCALEKGSWSGRFGKVPRGKEAALNG